MIKANELRIRNLFIDRSGTNKIMYITGIIIEPDGYEKIFYRPLGSKNKWEIFTTGIKPIPLTSKILEKCGFVNIGNGVFENLPFRIGYSSVRKRISWVSYYDRNLSVTSIDYLHQLQNLYFALTGEELEIKLT